MSEDLQKTEQETVNAPEATETPSAQGTVDKVEATVKETTETPTEDAIPLSKYNQAQMRIGQLEKEIKTIASKGDDSVAVMAELERLKGELAQREETERVQEEEKYMSDLRNSVIDEFPETKSVLDTYVQKNSMAVYPTETLQKAQEGAFNTAAGHFDSYRFDREARKEMKEQVSVIADALGAVKRSDEIKIDANNPKVEAPTTGVDIAVSDQNTLTDSEFDYLKSIKDKDFKNLYSGN